MHFPLFLLFDKTIVRKDEDKANHIAESSKPIEMFESYIHGYGNTIRNKNYNQPIQKHRFETVRILQM